MPERVFRDCPRGCSRWESSEDQSTHAGLTRADDVDNAVGGNFLHLPTFGQPTARDLFLQAIAPDARCITRSCGGDAELDVVCINQKTGAFCIGCPKYNNAFIIKERLSTSSSAF